MDYARRFSSYHLGRLNGNGGGELNLGFDEDAALRECRGMSFDDNPPLQHYLEHADFLAG
jgi:hypothetical protein